MEGHRHRALPIALALSLVAAGSASAFEQGERAATTERGVEVTITIGEDGTPVAEGGRVGGAGSCTWTVTPYPYTGIDPPSHYGTCLLYTSPSPRD